MKHHHSRSGNQKKKTRFVGLFFLPAFGRCCPSVSAHPANCVRCSSNIAIADHFSSKTFSFKHHLTGEAWQACRAILARHGQLAEQFSLFIQAPLDRRGMASLQSNSTFSFKHHSTGEAWPAEQFYLFIQTHSQLAEQFYLFIQTPLATGVACLARSLYIVRTSTIAKNRHLATLPWHGQFAEQFYLFIQTPLNRRGMASLQSNSTFSFKHHLTGEAWPACRAILPFHSNTT